MPVVPFISLCNMVHASPLLCEHVVVLCVGLCSWFCAAFSQQLPSLKRESEISSGIDTGCWKTCHLEDRLQESLVHHALQKSDTRIKKTRLHALHHPQHRLWRIHTGRHNVNTPGGVCRWADRSFKSSRPRCDELMQRLRRYSQRLDSAVHLTFTTLCTLPHELFWTHLCMKNTLKVEILPINIYV